MDSRSTMKSSWGFFALVSYIPDPLGSFLDGMRRSLPGYEFAQAHITILPPRRVALPAERASAYALETLRKFPPFDVNFRSVRRFEPTNILYLPLAAGNSCVNEMHQELNSGELAAEEEFEFVPHVTLGGPIPPHELQRAESAASTLWQSCRDPKHFKIDEVVALLALPNGGSGYGDWTCLWRHSLASDEVHRMIATQ